MRVALTGTAYCSTFLRSSVVRLWACSSDIGGKAFQCLGLLVRTAWSVKRLPVIAKPLVLRGL